MIITLRNDFHRSEARVRIEGIPGNLSPAQVQRARKVLCGLHDCTCGGVRGPQSHDGRQLWLEQTYDGQGRLGYRVSYADGP